MSSSSPSHSHHHSKLVAALSSFPLVLSVSVVLRVALILYSEWHDARSVVKYTDVDYRVFSDATRFALHPSAENRALGPLGKLLGLGKYVLVLLCVKAVSNFGLVALLVHTSERPIVIHHSSRCFSLQTNGFIQALENICSLRAT